MTFLLYVCFSVVSNFFHNETLWKGAKAFFFFKENEQTLLKDLPLTCNILTDSRPQEAQETQFLAASFNTSQKSTQCSGPRAEKTQKWRKERFKSQTK